jgi:BASS family bile acid:Na+ symporter
MDMKELLFLIMNLSTLVFVVTSMLAMGLSLTVAQIMAPLRNTRLVLLALLANFVLVPLMAYLISLVIPLSDGLRVGLILAATAAGAPFLPKLAGIARGNTAFSVGLMVLLMVVTVLYMPIVLPLLIKGVTVEPWDIARSLIILMLIPLAAGLVIKMRYVEIAAWLQPYMAQASTFAVALLLVVGLLANLNAMLAMVGTGGFIASLLFLVGAFVIGYFLGGKDAQTRSVLGLGTAQRNLAAALVVATANFADDPDVIMMVLALGLLGLVVLMISAGELGRRSKASVGDLSQA